MDFIKRSNPAITALVGINLLMFLCVRILYIASNSDVLTWLAVPAGWSLLLSHPWTLLTYMFTQYDLWQLLFNMLWLWWIGTLLAMLRGTRATVAVYLAGGVLGAVAFLICCSLVSSTGYLLGSSCSVLAVMLCTAAIAPSHPVNLLFLGEVKLKWVVAATMFLYAVGSDFAAPAACVAHLAGACGGAVMGIALRKRTKRLKIHRNLSLDGDDGQLLDGLLDKVRRSGFASLTPTERKLLIELTRHIGK